METNPRSSPASAANAAGSPGDEAQLVELSKSWSTAMNGHDRAKLEALIAGRQPDERRLAGEGRRAGWRRWKGEFVTFLASNRGKMGWKTGFWRRFRDLEIKSID